MEQQKPLETEPSHEKEEEKISGNPVSESHGDSVVQNGQDTSQAKQTLCLNNTHQTWGQNTLYPFYYKYPDNRKLTLLKSLSQDSEYSLDTSLFDAEDFLQEMGFAGSYDPTIPDRFLPSLMQRLSKFPESEIESLNDRIIQSIGCFKRKEGKRRLFRNLSMGKNPNGEQNEKCSLSISNSYPLIRSNTGPASYSFNDPASNQDASKSPSLSKESSTNSNNSSFAEEESLPQSPIAILVSAASVDIEQDESVSPDVLEKEPVDKDETQNLNEETESITNIPNYSLAEDSKVTCDEKGNEIVRDNTEGSEENVNSEVKHVYEISGKKDITPVPTKSSSEEDSTAKVIMKQPLRRLSQGSCKSYVADTNSVGTQCKTDSCDPSSAHQVKFDFSITADNSLENEPKTSTSITRESSLEYSEYSSCVSEKEEFVSSNSLVAEKHESEIKIEENNENKLVKLDSPHKSRPIYSRSDSLSDFLTSMLNTNDRLSPTLSSSQTLQNSLYSIQNESIEKLSSNPPNVQENSTISTPLCDTKLFGMHEQYPPQNHDPREKIPTRKRRLLRRMSSSLNYGDDEVSYEESKVRQNEKMRGFSAQSESGQHKNSLRNTAYLASCPIMYPCCCFPVTDTCSFQKIHRHHQNEGCFVPTMLQKKLNKQAFPFTRKIKRNYKRNRFFSCSSSISNFSCNSHCSHSSLPNSFQNFCSFPHNHNCCHASTFHAQCLNSQKMFDSRNAEFENVVGHNNLYKSGYSSDPQNFEHCSKFESFYYQNQQFQQNCHSSNICSNNRLGRNQWNSTPDISTDCYTGSNFAFAQKTADFSPPNTKSYTLDSLSYTSKDSYSHNEVFNHDKNSDIVKPQTGYTHEAIVAKHGNIFKSSPSQIQTDLYDHHPSAERSTYNSSFKSLFSKEIPPTKDFKQRHPGLETNDPHGLLLKASKSLPDDNFKSPIPNRRMSYQNDFASLPDQQNNKREALQEKKIRVFSKFFTNLGNLTKSVSDPNLDNDHKGTIEPQYHDFTVSDKSSNSYLYNETDNKHNAKTDRCQTSSRELDKLIQILNTMDLKSNPGSDEQALQHSSLDVCPTKYCETKSAVYENSVFLEMKQGDHESQTVFAPVSYTSTVSMQINDDGIEPLNSRSEKGIQLNDFNEKSALRKNTNLRRYSLQMPFKEVSKDLEDLQLSIQKAKEMRISASKELHLLQELLSPDSCDENESAKDKRKFFDSTNLYHEYNVKETDETTNKALADLRQKSSKNDSEEFWQEEMKKMKKENDEVWRAKLERMEKRLLSQEEELHKMQLENENLQKQLELQATGSPTCHCKPEAVQNGIGRTDSAFEDDEEYMAHKSSIPIQSSRQECERLQEQLIETEQRADQLNLLLNQKLIELNKLQLTLSKQTKEMIELEKSYLQLQHRLRKGTSKPTVERLCSRASPFNSKNLCPKPSPPASPHPTNGVA